MNDAILRFVYKLEFIFKILFTRSKMIIYCREDAFKAGDTVYFGSELKATFRKVKK